MAGTATQQIAVMGALGRGMRSLDELEQHLPLSRRNIVKAVGRLIGRDYAAREEAGVYVLTPAGSDFLEAGHPLRSGPRGPATGRRAPNRDTFRQRAWSAMRLSGRFTQADIVRLAGRPDDSDPAGNLQRFILLLLKAGYLALLPTRVPGTAETSNGYRLYMLVRDTGEAAPMHRVRHHVLSDLNTGEDFPCR